jgi:RNA polymerase sigma factor (sigma-70 family)
MSVPGSPEHERRLLKLAVEGSEDAWHEFVDRYSGLIFSLIRRYLPHPNDDDRRSVYVDVLETLYEGALARYDGRASLATWIGVVTRSRCMDWLRHRSGRHRDPSWLEELPPFDQEIYRLFYVKGLSFTQICQENSGNAGAWSVDQLVEALDRIEARFDRSTRRRLAFELESRSVASATGRLLEYMAHARQEAEEAKAAHSSDLGILEWETRRLLARLHKALEELELEEREVIRLRFQEGLTAESVAARLGLLSARRVYTISDRALRKLRSTLEIQGA